VKTDRLTTFFEFSDPFIKASASRVVDQSFVAKLTQNQSFVRSKSFLYAFLRYPSVFSVDFG
jgi:hypothetical protein